MGIYLLVVSIVLWGARLYERIHYEGMKISRVPFNVILGLLWKAVVIFPVVLLSFIVIAPRVSEAIRAKVIEEREQPISSEAEIVKDFRAGEISADEYVNYLIDAEFSINELPEKYRANNQEIVPGVLDAAEENYDSLSDETKLKLYNTVLLGNMAFGTDASENVSFSDGLFTDNAYAGGNVYIKTLNKAKKSSGGNFIVFYTDTGDDKISDEDAEELGEMMERIITGYKSELGMDYNLEVTTLDTNKLGGVIEVLEANGLTKEDFWTAMPVYVINPMAHGETNTLASYAGRMWSDFWKRVVIDLVSAGNIVFNEDDRTFNMYRSAPTLPFINIMPKNAGAPDLELVSAHELGHHYAGEYTLSKYGEYSKTPQFINETIANYMANRVVNSQPVDNTITGHHGAYMEYGVCYPVSYDAMNSEESYNCNPDGSFFRGYIQFSFLQNYFEVVPNGHQIILDALYTEEPIKYLHEKAGDTLFRTVMKKQTQRSLLNDYGTNALKASKTPVGEEIPCTDMCSKDYSIYPVSSAYLYFANPDYHGKKIIVDGEGLDFTLMGVPKNATKYEIVDEQSDSLEFEFKEDDKYIRYAITISNPSIVESGSYKLEITDAEAEEMFDKTEKNEKVVLSDDWDIEDVMKIRGNCADVNMRGLIDLSAKLTGNITSFYGAMYEAMGETEAANELNEQTAQIQSDMENAKKNVSFNTLTICEKAFKEGVGYSDAEKFATKKMSNNIRLYENNQDGIHMGVYMAYNIFNGQAKAYLLWQDDTDNRVRLYNFSVK